MDWIVLKFGGTSVASRERWETIAEQVRGVLAEGHRPLVVCSAVSGVTNLLESLPDAARDGDADDVLTALRDKHSELAEALGVDLDAACAAHLSELARVSRGIGLLGEVSPRTRARILAAGELMSTRLGAAFLQAQGVDAGWLDAREALIAWTRETGEGLSAVDPAGTQADPIHAPRWFLSAQVHDARDPAMRERLDAQPTLGLITQGFVAGTLEGDTVVLGRGGSDTSASVFAARLGALRCEIWTDVPGMFTADPRILRSARLLTRLDYDEAQEIASTGAKVLHPRSIPPLRRHGIPMHIRCAPDPSMPSTVIDADAASGSQVKALSSKRNVTLVSMDALDMWQQVGFLADVFGVFKAHGVSVDLVSTSEFNVTVTLDRAANPMDEAAVSALATALGRHCRVQITQGLSAISLVGRGIRSILHRLGAALEQFEEQPVRLVTQAASDLNLTVVVDADREERIMRRLHLELFQGKLSAATFGPTWASLHDDGPASARPTRKKRWWAKKADALLAIAAESTPTYVYDAETVRKRASALTSLTAVDRVFYAMKANPHPGMLDIVHAAGLGFECVSPGEIALARAAAGPDGRILFTPNFAPRADYEAAYAAGATVTIDNLHPLEHWGEVFAGRELMVRVDIGSGRGHHKHVKTAGAKSKFGLDPEALPRLRELADAVGAKVVGLHAHSGSGIDSPEAWRDVATRLAEQADGFPDLRVFDVGGGLGVPYKPGQASLDLREVDVALQAAREAWPIGEMWIEPGRFVVAESGVLLARVTQVKQKRGHTWVGVDAGMHSLLRPALYGAWHNIINLSKLGEPATGTVEIVGPICESGDVLGRGRQMPTTTEGDVLLIDMAGAYGMSMASNYNHRGLPREVILP